MEEILKFLLPVLLAILAWWLKSAREHNTVGRAICAEIIALMEIIEERDFINDLEITAKSYEKSKLNDEVTYQVPVSEHYCRVYAGNIQNIGYLEPDQAELIVRFYQLIDSAIRDVSDGGCLAGGASEAESFEETARILRKAVRAGVELKELRERRAAEPFWKRYLRALQ